MLIIFLISTLAYFIGALSSSIIICKICNLPDPRSIGSGNAGATNVSRFASKKISISVLIADILKGVVAIILAKYFLDSNQYLSLITFFVVIGHIYPVFFKFQGGKGIATFLGALTVLSPTLSLIAVTIWLIVAKLFKYSSLASLIAIITTCLSSIIFSPIHFIGLSCTSILIVLKQQKM